MDHKDKISVSNKLSPTEIKNKEFGKVVLGYSPREVVGFLDSIAKTWEMVQKNERALLGKIESLEEEIDRWKAKEGELDLLRQKALVDAEVIRNQASKEAARSMQEVEERAAGVRRGVEEWLTGLISNLEETQKQKNNFLTAFKASLDSHYQILRNQGEEETLGSQLLYFLNAGESRVTASVRSSTGSS